jgi:hypothetical protein
MMGFGGGCFNLMTSKNHCGMCTTACPGAMTCMNGMCM